MIKVGIVGYGNLGRGVELSLKQNPDFELIAVFTRRDPKTLELVDNSVKKDHIDNILAYKGLIDVMILCGGSKSDLPVQAPLIAKDFCFVDSFDTHSDIPRYYQELDEILKANNNTGLISSGWDPGLFSINRLLFESILPVGNHYTFWGDGVSQGHSDAIRKVKGVKYACQYTVPVKETLEAVRSGTSKNFSTKEKHRRVCFVVTESIDEQVRIEQEIKTMPAYFADYDTEVNFISETDYHKNHNKMPHGGFVIHNGITGEKAENKHLLEFALRLDSNPEFTASVVVCYARAVYKLSKAKDFGCKTVFDVPLAYLSAKSPEELRKVLL
ncbi:MAG: diaminopimelate dehydrogenase [Erysipelotrichales bacterium]|nr:diaminopimelate dehydrogenase [Erysipelotrichales bacterium]